MGNRGRLIAPGGLRDELAEVAEDEPAAGESLAEMAAHYGLTPSSARPDLVSYLARVWQRRHFILAYATARNVSMYTEARLGQLWQVLTPLLNSAVYYLAFAEFIFRSHCLSRREFTSRSPSLFLLLWRWRPSRWPLAARRGWRPTQGGSTPGGARTR